MEKNKKLYASGIRNAVGLTINPSTNQIWADNNGSDKMGQNIPPEWIDIVRKDGFYGHPFAYGNQIYFDFNSNSDYQALLPITKADSERVKTMNQPAALVQAHSALMGLKFSNNGFPGLYKRGLFVVSRGSFDASPAVGYKIMFLEFKTLTDTIALSVSDFMKGFLTDSLTTKAWARPVGIETDNRGNLFMTSDDINQFVAAVYFDSTLVGINKNEGFKYNLKCYPQPAKETCLIEFSLSMQQTVKLEIFDVFGRIIGIPFEGKLNYGIHEIMLDTKEFPSGIYFYSLNADGNRISKKMAVFK